VDVGGLPLGDVECSVRTNGRVIVGFTLARKPNQKLEVLTYDLLLHE